MKVYQVVPYFPPHIGGEETYVYMLSKELAARGYEVAVFTSSEGNSPVVEKIGGVTVHRLNVLMKVYNNPVALSLLTRLIHEGQPNILHAHQYPIFFSDVSALVSLMKHVPLLLQVHVIPESKSVLSSATSTLYYRLLWRFVLKSAYGVVVPSFAYRTLLVNMGASAEKIKVVPYGVDLNVFNPNNDGSNFRERYGCKDSRVILSVGRLNYQKGFQFLLQALPTIINELSDVKLVIVGDGEERASLQRSCESLKVADSVIFTGTLPFDEIPKAYAAADVFVLPSIFESFGITLMEAQATGKPVVGTNVGGVPEVVMNRETGILVEPGKPRDLADAIMRVLSDRKMARDIGRNGRRYVEKNFAWNIVFDKVVKLYEDLHSVPLTN